VFGWIKVADIKYLKHTFLYLCLILIPSFSFAGGIVFETETGYTWGVGTGAFADGDSRFSGMAITALSNNVTAITKANPGVVSSTAHGLSVGDLVYFDSLTEMTELNTRTVTVTVEDSANTFSIGDTSTYTAAETTGGACGHSLISLATQNFDGYLLELIDDSNRRAYGFIGPAETGKVLDTPVIDDDAADDDHLDWMSIDATITHDTDHYVVNVNGDGPTEDTCYMLDMDVMTVGVRYKISFQYYIPAGNTNVDTLSIRTYYDSIWKVPGLDTLNVSGAWTSAEAEVTCHDVLRDMLIFYMQDGESSDGLTLNDEIWLKDILVEPIAMEDPQAVTIYKQRDPINEGWRRIGNGFEFSDTAYTFNVYRLPGVQGQQW